VPLRDDQAAISTHPLNQCVVCGGPGIPLHNLLIDRLYGAPGTWSVRQCSNRACGLGWLDPQPATADIGKLYSSYYTHENVGELASADAQRSSRKKRMAKGIIAALLPWRRQALNSDMRYLAARAPGRLLDVGCGNGSFIAGMAQLGWEVTGVEFDEKAVEAARERGVRVLSGSLAEQRFPDDSFDAITLSNVIEHLPDPIGTFRELKRILAPGGRLVMVTPNIDSAGHRIFRRCWRGLEPPRHLFLFNRAVFRELARQSGLKNEACFTVPGSASQILESSLELWSRKVRGRPAPSIKVLKRRELMSTLLNGDDGEFVVLLATK
jgi:2-polyprenyl-3-methyl-5-hydroxy-6-metoxy-1,4-benzoquinol methylase